MPDVQAVRKTIKQLRDVPANTTGAGQDVLLLISDYLVELSPKDEPVHWFCRKADQLTIDCATFLLRLHTMFARVLRLCTWVSGGEGHFETYVCLLIRNLTVFRI